MRVFSFWQGKLSDCEVFCINSFIKQGIKFELYSYEPLANVPEGVICCDANTVVPQDQMFIAYEGGKKETMATFSDFFRYTKLYKDGGIWVDMDIIINKNFLQIENDSYFVAGESRLGKLKKGQPPNNKTHINNCVIKANKNADWVKELYELSVKAIEIKPVKHLTLHKIFCSIVKKYNLKVSDYWVIQSVDYIDIPKLKKEKLVDIAPEEHLKNCYGLHLYNSKFKRRPQLKGECLLNKLKEIENSIAFHA